MGAEAHGDRLCVKPPSLSNVNVQRVEICPPPPSDVRTDAALITPSIAGGFEGTAKVTAPVEIANLGLYF